MKNIKSNLEDKKAKGRQNMKKTRRWSLIEEQVSPKRM